MKLYNKLICSLIVIVTMLMVILPTFMPKTVYAVNAAMEAGYFINMLNNGFIDDTMNPATGRYIELHMYYDYNSFEHITGIDIVTKNDPYGPVSQFNVIQITTDDPTIGDNGKFYYKFQGQFTYTPYDTQEEEVYFIQPTGSVGTIWDPTGHAIILIEPIITNGSVYDKMVEILEDDRNKFSINLWIDSLEYTSGVDQASTEIPSLEGMIANTICGLANFVNKAVAKTLGRRVTIDDLVFDHYTATMLQFYSSGDGEVNDDGSVQYSEIIWGKNGTGDGGLYKTINQWYDFFRNVAIITYMILLVYMGIRILLSSTGEGLSKYKELFMYWILGIAILFFYPYVIKYTIKLNKAFVHTVEDSVTSILGERVVNMSPSIKSQNIGDLDLLADNYDENAFENGSDYMSVIAQRATETQRVALALAYLIMTWQLLTLIIHYYKRLFMTAFLIVIFPIVMLFYALDKIGDGKSQSFNKWNKEFILNVFIQSFHAIVYVFVCGTVYAAGSGDNYDFVLIIVGVTFLFTGEEIIKKIFSQESQSITRPLGETMMKAVAAVGVAKAVGGAVTKPFTKDGIINRGRISIAEMQNARTKQELFPYLATTNAPVERPERMDATSARYAEINASNASEDEKRQARAEVQRASNAVSTLRNAEYHSTLENARAWATVCELAAKGDSDPNSAILNDLNLSRAQISALSQVGANLAATYAAGIASGASTVDVNRDVRAELEVDVAQIVGNLDEPQNRRIYDMMRADLALRGASRNYSHEKTMEAIDEIDKLQEEFNFWEDTRRENPNRNENEINQQKRVFKNSSYQYISRAKNAFEDLEDEEATADDKKLAEKIAIYKNRGTGIYKAEEQFDAITLIEKAKSSGSKIAKRMVEQLEEEEEMDVDVARHVLANKISSSTDSRITSNQNLVQKALDAAESYEIEILEDGSVRDITRDGYFDDELSIHQVIATSNNSAARNAMVEGLDTAGRHSNQVERTGLMSAFEDAFVEEGIDITNDARHSTAFFEGETLEDIQNSRYRAAKNFFTRTAGFGADNSGKKLTDSYRHDYDR